MCRDMSDAKRNALYNSRVFGHGSEDLAQAPSNELSELKRREVTGHDIFNKEAATEVQLQACN